MIIKPEKETPEQIERRDNFWRMVIKEEKYLEDNFTFSGFTKKLKRSAKARTLNERLGKTI